MNQTLLPKGTRRWQMPPAFFTSSLLLLLLLVAGIQPASAQVAGSIAVYPENSSLEFNQTRQFSAYVPISPNTVVWSVNDIVGGDSTVGTISATGLYQPPAVIPAQNVLQIRARSTAFPTSVGTATLTITKKYPWLWGISPTSVPVGNFRISLNGSNFAPDSQVLANGVPLTTTYVSATRLTASGAAPAAATLQIAVRQPGPGAVTGNSVALRVTPAAITVAVSPAAPNIPLGATRTFSVLVGGTTNTALTWSVNGMVGGSPTVGTITQNGVYTAPTVLPSPATVTVRATSVADPMVSGQSVVTLTPPPVPVTVALSPATASVVLGATQPFSATVGGTANTAVTWSVNGMTGGSPMVGTISPAGLYTAPAVMPSPATVTVRATSVAAPTVSAVSTVTLLTPPPTVSVVVNPASANVVLGATRSFSATVSGSANTAVTWSVNGTPGGSASVGTISPAGLYTAPAVMPSPATVTVRASSVASPAVSAQAVVTLSAPPQVAVSLSAARFLEQTSFGPSPATLARVQELGIPAYLEEQMQLPETVIPVPSGNSMGALRQWMLHNYTSAPDQLRQRMAYSLGQIVVTSGNKLVYADEIVPWLRILSKHAFGNYRALLRDITTSPSMGKYLDLANSMKAGLSGGANENYPRELLQLFSIGLWMLNPDGSQVRDAAGNPVPAYTQETVQQLARALTGWTYATAPGAQPRANNWEYFGAPMESRQENHDTGAKQILGTTLPAGATVEQDLEAVLDVLMNHPNIAPFIATRLIRSLVLSNPSAGYVQRVASVFSNNGQGVRGDLGAVLRAIVLDPEARQDVATVNSGRLKEPILHLCGLLRTLNGGFGAGQQLTYLFDYMAQSVLSPPSVFNWFSPMYRVPKSSLFGPEFQIYTATEATLRGNMIYLVLNSNGGDTSVDLTPFQPYGNDMAGLVEVVNQRLLYGRMPEGMKQVLINAAAPGYDARTRIQTVLYLTALSGQYAVQH